MDSEATSRQRARPSRRAGEPEHVRERTLSHIRDTRERNFLNSPLKCHERRNSIAFSRTPHSSRQQPTSRSEDLSPPSEAPDAPPAPTMASSSSFTRAGSRFRPQSFTAGAEPTSAPRHMETTPVGHPVSVFAGRPAGRSASPYASPVSGVTETVHLGERSLALPPSSRATPHPTTAPGA